MSKTQRHLGAISPAVNLALFFFCNWNREPVFAQFLRAHSTHNLDAVQEGESCKERELLSGCWFQPLLTHSQGCTHTHSMFNPCKWERWVKRVNQKQPITPDCHLKPSLVRNSVMGVFTTVKNKHMMSNQRITCFQKVSKAFSHVSHVLATLIC